MLLSLTWVKISGLSLGLIVSVCYFLYSYKRTRKYLYSIWLFKILEVIKYSFIVFAVHFYCIMLAMFFGASIQIIDSTTSHNIYFLFGANDAYPNAKPRESYVANRLDRTIVVWSLHSENNNGYTQDFEVIRPGQIGPVHSFPAYFFEKTPSSYRARSLVNAVDFWEQ